MGGLGSLGSALRGEGGLLWGPVGPMGGLPPPLPPTGSCLMPDLSLALEPGASLWLPRRRPGDGECEEERDLLLLLGRLVRLLLLPLLLLLRLLYDEDRELLDEECEDEPDE